MSRELADILDFDLAWRRVMYDRPDRCFGSHPYLIPVIEQSVPEWLGLVRDRVANGYAPSPCPVLPVPKGNWQVRPGAHLRLEDELVYNALVGSFLDDLIRALGPAQGDPDVAYQLADRPDRVAWVKRGVPIWKEWRERSKLRIIKGTEFVVFSDISAFYENVDLKRLISDLRALGLGGESEQLLANCLNRWAEPRGKGIPQGYSASDILAKAYLSSIDSNLQREGFNHLRYVDDIRIFCRDSLEAKRALLVLSELARTRGLNLQSAKTEVLRADRALHRVDGVTQIIENLNDELLAEIEVVVDESYWAMSEMEKLAATDPEAPPAVLLDRAFESHFVDPAADGFNKSLFHFLLTRLGVVNSRHAVEYCLNLLPKKPEETPQILHYLGKVGLEDADHRRILQFLASPECIYEYQVFLILRHYYGLGVSPLVSWTTAGDSAGADNLLRG